MNPGRVKPFSIKLSELFIILLTIITVSLIGYNYKRTYDLTYGMTMKLQQEIALNIETLTTKTLEISSNNIEILSKLGSDTRDIFADVDGIVAVMYRQLEAYDYLNSIYIANDMGEMIQLRRYPQTILRTIRRTTNGLTELWEYKDASYVTTRREYKESHFDAMTRPWYTGVTQPGTTFWSHPYIFATSGELGITASCALYDGNGSKLKVVGADITYWRLNSFIRQQGQKVGGDIIVLDEDDNIVASSLPKYHTDLKSILNVKRFDPDDAIARIIRSSARSGQIGYNDGEYLYFVHNTDPQKPYKWKIITLIPEEIILGEAHKTIKFTLLISVVLFGIFVFLILYFSKRISQPIEELSRQIDQLTHLNLETTITRDSKITEIQRAQCALNSLQTALKSFVKYIPLDVVRILLELNIEAKVGGEEKDLAIMFTDIENFTTIAEETGPMEIAEQLSEYFEAVNSVIKANHGTIDKYIGDSVLAFWGAPRDVETPAYDAVKTMIGINQALEMLNAKWADEGKSPFRTRIGIHYGKTLVGNIGSSKRINYTIIGDSVNIAARLEGINKNYGTYNMISEQVREQVEGDFDLRYVDTIELKGKHKATKLYTVLF